MRIISVSPYQLLLAVWVTLFSPLYAGELQPASCLDFINETTPRVTCGFMTLPLDHERTDHRSVRLPVLIAHSTRSMSSQSSRAILIPGAGGPGASMGFGYRYRRGEFLQPYNHLLQAGYDVVILDQRGAGLSSPRLTCFEAIEVFRELITSQRNLDEEIHRYQLSADQCRNRLQKHGIEMFDTTQSARDFLAVMAALDYEWWGTIATSYATAITQTMLEIKPNSFDKVVLDSPVPLDYQKPLTTESTYQSVLKSIDRCNTTRSCQRRYPDLTDAFDRIINRARTTPYQLSLNIIDSSFHRKEITLYIDDDTLLSIFANSLYSNEGIALLPSVVDTVDRGRLHALQPLAEEFWYQSTDADYADGLNLTVHCKERLALENQYVKAHPDYLDSLSADTRKLLQAQNQLCDIWGVRKQHEPVTTKNISAPALIISGTLDPVISKEDISNTIDDFEHVIGNSKITGAGHAVWFQSNCVRIAVTAFFDGGAAEELAKCELGIPEFK